MTQTKRPPADPGRFRGTLVFNDCVRWSHLEGMHYGIVPAVNELVRDGWRVVAFALSARGYPDIAVKRV